MGRLRVCAPRVIASHQRGTRRRYPFFLAFLLLVSLLAACGDGSAAAQPARSPTKAVSTSTPTPTKEVIISPLVGIYTTIITKKDVSAQPDLASDLGTHTWTFRNNGTFRWSYRGPATQNTPSFAVAGTYQVSASELSVKDPYCDYEGFPGSGTYTWRLKGNDLSLQVKSDDCVDRKFALTTHPLVKQAS